MVDEMPEEKPSHVRERTYQNNPWEDALSRQTLPRGFYTRYAIKEPGSRTYVVKSGREAVTFEALVPEVVGNEKCPHEKYFSEGPSPYLSRLIHGILGV
jgi:hypothetical protein